VGVDDSVGVPVGVAEAVPVAGGVVAGAVDNGADDGADVGDWVADVAGAVVGVIGCLAGTVGAAAAECAQFDERAAGNGRADGLAAAPSVTTAGPGGAPTIVLADVVPSASVAFAAPATAFPVPVAHFGPLAVCADVDACPPTEESAPGVGCPGPGRPAPPPAGTPLPFVLVPCTPAVCPPVSTAELAWTIACRRGGTASVADAIKATPPRTAAGRIQLLRAAWMSARDMEGGTGRPVPAQCRTWWTR
jgi:hypothetical protein